MPWNTALFNSIGEKCGLEVRLRPEAEQDLADAAAWYEEQRHGLGHEFLDEVLRMFSSIAETPLMYPDIHPLCQHSCRPRSSITDPAGLRVKHSAAYRSIPIVCHALCRPDQSARAEKLIPLLPGHLPQ